MTIQNITDREIALQARVKELEKLTLNQRITEKAYDLLEAQCETLSAQIEASRKQVPCAFTNASWLSNPHAGHFSAVKTDCFNVPLFTAPVVAPDVLKDAERYRWISKQDHKDRQWVDPYDEFKVARDKQIDAAMGGAND